MPEASSSSSFAQQRRAAAASARVRFVRRLVRELGATQPLTVEQRAELIAAAAAVRVVDRAAS